MAGFYEKVSPLSFTRSGTVCVNGAEVSYRLIAENDVIRMEERDAVSLFSFSYLKEGPCDENRPVLFLFNGGPTSNSGWLHLGFYGPRILKPGADGLPDAENPGALRENPDCLLDFLDLVCYDPVNTGFSRVLDPEFSGRCNSDHDDGMIASEFVKNWLRKHGREGAPVYLSGESFGSTRASVMADYLKDSVNLRGIIHIGPGYSSSEATIRTYKDLVPVAAVNWYHTEGEKPDLAEWISECREFLYHEYVPAYYMGTDLPSDRASYIAERLSFFTGVEKEVFLQDRLKVDRNRMRALRLKEKGLVFGSYDGRFTAPEGSDTEAFTASFDPAVQAGLERYFSEFDISTGLEYRRMSADQDPEWYWNYNASPDILGMAATGKPMDLCIADAMTACPNLRLFYATGYFDTVATVENTRYSVTHSPFNRNRVTLKEYASGHAVYADDAARHQLASDIRIFLTIAE